jgi:hypothetical protein
MSSSPESSSWDVLQTHLQGLQFDALPAFSDTLRQSLREESPGLHASLHLEANPVDFPAWADLFRTEEADAALCGFSGYGVQSVFFLLHWRHGPLILLSRTHFGAFGDAARDAGRASGLVALANALMLRADELQASGLWPEHRLMLIIDDELDGSGWCWINAAHELESYTLDTSLGFAGAFAALDLISPSEPEALS